MEELRLPHKGISQSLSHDQQFFQKEIKSMNNRNGRAVVGDLLALGHGQKDVFDYSTASFRTYPANSLFLICALDASWGNEALLLCPDGNLIRGELTPFKKAKDSKNDEQH